LVKEEVHGSEISLDDALDSGVGWISSIDGESMALSVEDIAVSGNGTVE
jgi:hypothetical protein